MIPTFIALYVGHKLYARTRVVPLAECDFTIR
jgi:amino acid permease